MKNKNFPTIKIAAVQAEDTFLDLDRAVEKTISLIDQAGENNCNIIVFPESYIPGYPDWWEFYPERFFAREWDKKLFLNSISLESEYMDSIREACKRNSIYAVLGINETEEGVIGTMHNCQVYISKDGTILGKHQKYCPTVCEKLTQAPGNTGYFNSFKADFGAVSGLICGENSNPLGVYAAVTQYPVLHCASWPAHYGPDADLKRVHRMATKSNAYTLKAFVVNSVSRISDEYLEAMSVNEESVDFLKEKQKELLGATVIDPWGNIIANGDGDENELLICEVDLQDTVIPHVYQDFAGHYQREEIFAPLFAKYFEK